MFQEAETLLSLGEARLTASGPEQAEVFFLQSLELGRRVKSKILEGRIHLALGQLSHGDQGGHLKTAAKIFADAKANAWHTKVVAALVLLPPTNI